MSKHSQTLQEKKNEEKKSPTTTCIVPNLLAFLARSIQCREGRPIATLLCRTRRRGSCSHMSPTVPKRPGGRINKTFSLDRTINKKIISKLQKFQKFQNSKTPKYSNHKRSTSRVYHQPAPTHQCHQRRPVLHHVCPHHVPGQQVFQKRRFCSSPDL
jgi:hypothetical protein